MRKYKAIKPGFYLCYRDPDHPRHSVFEAPDDFEASWAVPLDQAPGIKEPDTDEDVEVIEEPAEEGTTLSADKPASEGPVDLVEKVIEDDGVEVL